MKSYDPGNCFMKPDAPQLATLSAMITRDLEAIERLDRELTPLKAGLKRKLPDFRDLAAVAYILHNVYGYLENIFEQVSKAFENHITDQAQWHRELLTKMFLEIPTIRPPLLPPELRSFLNDLRGFRHIFRHAYEFELDAEKLSLLVRDWDASRATLISALSTFRAVCFKKPLQRGRISPLIRMTPPYQREDASQRIVIIPGNGGTHDLTSLSPCRPSPI
jgi:hypothetical protein